MPARTTEPMGLLSWSTSDVEAIRRAVAAVEAESAGEIVPYVVAASDLYHGAAWKGAAFGAMTAPLLACAFYSWSGWWGTAFWLWMILPPAAGAALGLLL